MASPRRHSALPFEALPHRPFRDPGGWHAAALLKSLRHDEGDDRLAMSAFEHARLLDREPDPDGRDQSQSALPLVVGRSWWAGYAVALVTTALAVGLRVLLDAYLGRGLTFLLAYPPVMISAIYGGFGPALLSTVLSEVMLLALADPTASEANTPLRMIVFGASGLVIGTMAESLHRARRRAHEASVARGRSERTLESAQDRLRVIVDAAPALISYIDTQLRYRLVNATYEKWFQRSPAEVYGRPVADVLGPAAFELERPHMEAALRGELVSFEKELPYPHGARWVQVTYAPERSRDGRVRGFVAHVSDVTARKRAEAALVRSAQQSDGLSRLVGALSEALSYPQVARAVIEHAVPLLGAVAGAVAVMTEDGEHLDLLDSTGYEPAVLAKWQRFPISLATPMGEAARTRAIVFVSSLEERARRFPDLPPPHSGHDRATTASLPLVVLGRTLGVLGITWNEPRQLSDDERELVAAVGKHCAQAFDRARLYESEQRARAQAERASLAKDEFLAMLGHELRNPLAPILTAIELMKLHGDRLAERERVVMERQARHLVQLVDDLLDVSRIARGKLELKSVPLELGKAVARAVEIASPLLEQQAHRLQVSVASQGLLVVGDETRLAQVFANLLTNAAKYTDPGGEIVIAAAREGDEIVVRVRDTGVGIAPELLPHIFDLFVQGPRRVDRSRGGLGLGLALVSNLVGLHGGRVDAHSEGSGRGSEFVVRLPAAPAEARHDTGPLPAARTEPVPSGCRLLVVDDNLDAAEMLSVLLETAGYQTVVAHDGPAALEVLGRFRPQVAILDIGLPVMDGYELAQRIRTASGDEPPPVLVALTGYGQAADRARSRQAGFAAHLVKPVDVSELLRTIDEVGRKSP
jgi:PAS domain S-box-containing protein